MRHPLMMALGILFSVVFPQTPAFAVDDDDWTMAVRLGSADAYFSYLLRNPTGVHVTKAVIALRALEAITDPEFALEAAQKAARRPPAKKPARTPTKSAQVSKSSGKSLY